MRVHIDEARRHELASRIDLLARAAGQLTDRDDAFALDGDIGFERLSSGAIDDEPSTDQQVVSHDRFSTMARMAQSHTRLNCHRSSAKICGCSIAAK